MRKQITTLAHAIRKTGQSWAEAMKRAWAAIRIKFEMAHKAVGFFYKKENGETRYAVGYNKVAPPTSAKPAPAKSALVITYFDIDRWDWRSFRADRLIIE
ncbi:SH3 beta-barrel fold-containing protein [Spirosoma sordidisoli]|uniref:DUF2693 domain-containing protein n=1 Tax=Spirosoma sordidisoli TaxID=2502893 RepID=A0A4Q2UMM5_9BACT|nr:SH3 beta-barrel fold-containing protein [Spirosoma sordidisoli]RYC70883.1 hypothetical protein EQG79_01645 [Spirosoma sordidisoli]